MDNLTLHTLIENDKEWRAYMIKSIEIIRMTGIKNSKDIIGLKTWNIIWRFLGLSFFSVFLYLLRDTILK